MEIVKFGIKLGFGLTLGRVICNSIVKGINDTWFEVDKELYNNSDSWREFHKKYKIKNPKIDACKTKSVYKQPIGFRG